MHLEVHGNPGGAKASIYGVKGNDGTGGLLITYANIFNNSGIMYSNGSNGGYKTEKYASGGSSGGGSVNVFYKNGENIGNVKAKGGKQDYGGMGGYGTVTIGSISSGTFDSNTVKIYTKGDLERFSTDVNDGNTYLNTTVELMNDIDLEGSDSNLWVAIGTSTKQFKGIFNGNGHTISGLYINATTDNKGLFGYSDGGKIENLTLENVNITSTKNNVGAMLGKGVNSTIENVQVSGKITSTGNNVGAIVGNGETVKIKDCQNYATLEGKFQVAGIAGLINTGSSITNSSNYNTASITATGRNDTTYNEANVGGIVGLVGGVGDNKIENCENFANVTGSYNGVGGIVGTSMSGTITKSANEGVIEGGKIGTGGIAGFTGYYNTTRKVTTKSIIDNCTNKGEIISTGYQVGGITGRSENGSEIKNSNNYGAVTGTGKDGSSRGMVAGIVGNQSIRLDNGVACSTENCNNYGNISSQYYMCGGIVGWQQRGNVKNCINEGNVTNERADIGGISGQTGRSDDSAKTNGTVENCLNKGNITINGTGANAHNAGGITGVLTYGSEITSSGNIGDVTTNGYASSTDKTSRTGGIVGIMPNAGANMVTYCYNTGNVTGAYKYIGGIAGMMNIATANIDHCYSVGTVSGPANIGGIVGYKKGTVTESYYLENSVQPTTGNPTAEGTSANEATIKSIINLDIWKEYFQADKTESINKGWPILKWQ